MKAGATQSEWVTAFPNQPQVARLFHALKRKSNNTTCWKFKRLNFLKLWAVKSISLYELGRVSSCGLGCEKGIKAVHIFSLLKSNIILIEMILLLLWSQLQYYDGPLYLRRGVSCWRRAARKGLLLYLKNLSDESYIGLILDLTHSFISKEPL